MNSIMRDAASHELNVSQDKLTEPQVRDWVMTAGPDEWVQHYQKKAKNNASTRLNINVPDVTDADLLDQYNREWLAARAGDIDPLDPKLPSDAVAFAAARYRIGDATGRKPDEVSAQEVEERGTRVRLASEQNKKLEQISNDDVKADIADQQRQLKRTELAVTRRVFEPGPKERSRARMVEETKRDPAGISAPELEEWILKNELPDSLVDAALTIDKEKDPAAYQAIVDASVSIGAYSLPSVVMSRGLRSKVSTRLTTKAIAGATKFALGRAAAGQLGAKLAPKLLGTAARAGGIAVPLITEYLNRSGKMPAFLGGEPGIPVTAGSLRTRVEALRSMAEESEDPGQRAVGLIGAMGEVASNPRTVLEMISDKQKENATKAIFNIEDSKRRIAESSKVVETGLLPDGVAASDEDINYHRKIIGVYTRVIRNSEAMLRNPIEAYHMAGPRDIFRGNWQLPWNVGK